MLPKYLLSMRTTKWIGTGVVVFVLTSSMSTSSQAQSIVTVELTKSAADAGGPGRCRVTAKPSSKTGANDADTVDVEVLDDAMNAPAQLASPLIVVIGDEIKGEIDKGASGKKISVGAQGLSDQIVRIRRKDADHLEEVDKDICEVNAVPLVSVAVPANVTDFVADGAVSTALRTGAAQPGATGSLGIHHRYVKPARKHLLWMPVDVEEFRGLITVASSGDTLTGITPGNFAQAILAPETATRGNLGSVYLEYHPMERYGNGDQFRGLWMSARVVRSLWRSVPHSLSDGTNYTGSLTKNITISTLDVRYRWTPIARITDARGNVFQVNFDLGYTARALDGDGGLDTTFLRGTLETRRRVFHGPIAAVGISLRQVQAIAEVPYFLRSKTESLEGLQPVFRFSFEAPMIRF